MPPGANVLLSLGCGALAFTNEKVVNGVRTLWSQLGSQQEEGSATDRVLGLLRDDIRSLHNQNHTIVVGKESNSTSKLVVVTAIGGVAYFVFRYKGGRWSDLIPVSAGHLVDQMDAIKAKINETSGKQLFKLDKFHKEQTEHNAWAKETGEQTKGQLQEIAIDGNRMHEKIHLMSAIVTSNPSIANSGNHWVEQLKGLVEQDSAHQQQPQLQIPTEAITFHDTTPVTPTTPLLLGPETSFVPQPTQHGGATSASKSKRKANKRTGSAKTRSSSNTNPSANSTPTISPRSPPPSQSQEGLHSKALSYAKSWIPAVV
eukprot:TRINITY_DN35295_c0_g1_i1.p1 TRINITY_DN35295_c0_g1~~TRINITY_DN35295_c0_g1_i1.p1  ORF type:complete len:315 (+),score=39.58 TRINITY_DN35295_c0_g1_i1:74-1018(+)